MMETKTITYHIQHDDPAPVVGQYMVFVGKRGILSVHLVRSVRKVVPRVISEYAKYRMVLLPQPELKALTDYEWDEDGLAVWVRGEPALPSVWMPRSSK
ncbi:hypothetical protein [Spirosoma sordidisoli]|uniref:Uncharacterized protein n=1 Tax=Spirosoma sordidisoli TaxID=2502893 RepID=A0A4Q2UT17_9BACT|nr:hypothetical protein [Spirosoma sordidisoli]RYC70880.1 hypothetical protein EQG79_01630 [Spirosoma sordidisoli]